MMGNIKGEDSPVTKTTNAVLVLPREHSLIQKKNQNPAIGLKRAASACCQCQACTDLCPRHALGHPIEPHKFMRAAANRDFRDANPFVNTFFCSSCGLCELYSCPVSYTHLIHSKNVDNITKYAKAIDTAILVKNAPSYAALGFGGEGFCTFTIASRTGEGLTSASTFTKRRRCVMSDSLCIR